MRTIFERLFSVLLVVALGIGFASCGENEEPAPQEDPNEVALVVGEYNVSLAENYYKYFDVVVEYSTPGGTVQKETLKEDWVYTYKIEGAAVANQYVCKVVATPKNPMPAVEPGVTYNVDKNVKADVTFLNAAGKVVDGRNGSNIGTETLSAEQFKKFITRTRTILNYTFVPEKK